MAHAPGGRLAPWFLLATVACGSEVQIANFVVDQATIGRGESVVLDWDVVGARRVYLLADPPEALGVYDVASAGRIRTQPLLRNTTLTVRAVRGLEVLDRSVNVTVLSPLEIVRFVADPTEVGLGRSTTLSYQVAGATEVRLKEGSTLLATHLPPFPGRFEVTPAAASTRYVLEAIQRGETEQRELVVTTREPGEILEFSATPLEFASASAQVTIQYRTEGTTQLSLYAGDRRLNDFPSVASGSYVTRLTGTTRFELRAGGARAALTVRALGSETEPNDTVAQAGAIGAAPLSGEITPGDRDLYRLELTRESSLALALESCSGALTLALLDAEETVIGQATAGSEGCPALGPGDTAALGALEAGVYYVRVAGANGAASGSYRLLVRVGANACGDGELSGAERCDDGNENGGDGCSADCSAIEAIRLPAVRRILATGAIAAGERAVYELEVSEAGTLAVEVGVPVIGACGGQNPDGVLELYDSSRTLLATDDDGGFAPCPALNAGLGSALILSPGSYRLELFGFGSAPLSEHQVLITYTGQTKVENVVAPGATVIVPPGASVFSVGVTISDPGQSIRARFANGVCGYLNVVGLIEAPSTPLGGEAWICGGIEPSYSEFARDLAVGEYLVRVAPDAEGTREVELPLEIQIIDPGCGNGVFEPHLSEGCDDGNTRDGDLCLADCSAFAATIVPETEPNDSAATANAVLSGPGAVRIEAALAPTQTDFYAISFTGAARRFRAYTQDSAGTPLICENVDSILTLTDAGGAAIATNDDTFRFCSALDPSSDLALAALPAGTYYLEVTPYSDATFDYGLTIELD